MVFKKLVQKAGRNKVIGTASVIGAFALLGLAMLIGTRAATFTTGIEAESGTRSGNAVAKNGVNGASNNSMVQFGAVGGVTPNPTTPPTPPAGNVQYPADLFNKNEQWKITIPEVSGGKVVEIKPPAFGTYASKFFFLNSSKTAAIFRVWHGGGTTSNSSNPRSELRERYNNDPEGYWNAGSGTHTMEVVTQVNRLTKVKPHVVIAQVHDEDDDVSVWRVEGKELWITKGDETHGFLVDDNFQLGKKVTLKYVITSGKYEYYYNGTKVNFTLTNTKPSYFKAGNYLQSNPSSASGESTSEYSEVEMYSAKVTHN